MKRPLYAFAGLAAAISVLCLCSQLPGGRTEDEREKAFYAELDSLAWSSRQRELVTRAAPAYERATAEGDRITRVKTGCRLGRAYYNLFLPDSMYWYFDAVYPEAEKARMYPERIAMLNTLGVFNMVNAINYNQAIDYFYQAMNLAAESGDRDSYYKSLTNVTIIHYFRRDPDGVASAREIYEYGCQSGNADQEYTGALMLAYMHHALNEDAEALRYIDRAMRHPEYSTGANSSDALRASVLAALGRDKEAEHFFRKCIDDDETDNTLLLEALSGYGKFLAAKGRYDEAIRYYRQGLDITEKHHLYFYGHVIYRELADLYSAIGKYDLAVDYLNAYQTIADNVFNVEKERAFNNLRRKFDKQVAETRIQQKDMQILRQKQSLGLIGAALLVAVILAAAIYTNYRMRDRMYRRLVIKYNAFLRKEHALLNGGTADEPEEGDDRMRELFEQLDATMRREKLYTRKNITIEETARLLGTNRVYISKAVNSFAGVSFNAYINSFRIKAAVEILSDPHDQTPIKVLADGLGYNNLTSFYNNFFKETGVPPSKFRLEIRRLAAGRNRTPQPDSDAE